MQLIGSIYVFRIKGKHSKARELFRIMIIQNRPDIDIIQLKSQHNNYASNPG